MHANTVVGLSSTPAIISTPESLQFTRPWLTAGEAAERIGVSIGTIYDACALQRLTHVRLAGRRTIRIKPEWLELWMAQHTVEHR
jgi:excisionase family DNA binding protein